MGEAVSAALQLESCDVVPITRFARLFDTSAQSKDVAWPALFEEFSKRADFRGAAEHPGWSPAEFHPPVRNLESVERVHALVIEGDNKDKNGDRVSDPVTIDSMLVSLSGLYGFLHTTKSHTPDWPRFRVVLPLSRAVTPAEYAKLWQAANQRWPGLDPAPKDPSRFWYTPGGGSDFLAFTLDGVKLNPDGMLKEPPTLPSHPAASPGSTREARASAYIEKMPAAISGAGGHNATWAVARKLVADFGLDEPTALGLMLAEYNPRCQPPWTEKDLRHKVMQATKARVANPVQDRSDWVDESGVHVAAEPEPDPTPQRQGCSIAEVLDTWRTEGPLIHEPTGFVQLDELTGGGPVYGSRWYVNGAPDAGKTAFLVQLGHLWLSRGIVVGILAVDEEASDLVTRFAQRVGHSRRNCEARDPAVLDQIKAEIGDLPALIFDDSYTIEQAATALAKRANGKRMALLIDSLQTVNCDAERAAQRDVSEVAAVTGRVRAIRSVATEHKLIAVTAGEMSRAAYSKIDPDERTSTLASSKWSGATEYSARVLLGLRSIKDESDLIEVDIGKNKHGPRDRQFFLTIDRASQTLFESNHQPPPKLDAEGKKAEKHEKLRALILGALPETGHLSADELCDAVASKGGPKSINSLRPSIAGLVKDGRMDDLSGGGKGEARMYARRPLI
jgi:hypothetical protein